MRFVEAVFGKLLHQVKQALGNLGIGAALGRAFEEDGALLGHFLGFLFTHGAPQHVGGTEAVAGQNLCHQHHLLLVDDDAVGRFQHRLEVGVKILRLLLALLARDEVIHHARAKRARTVERHQGDDVFEAVALELLFQILGRARFGLEHRRGVTVGKQLVNCRIVERQVFQAEVRSVCVTLHEAHRLGKNGQRA